MSMVDIIELEAGINRLKSKLAFRGGKLPPPLVHLASAYALMIYRRQRCVELDCFEQPHRDVLQRHVHMLVADQTNAVPSSRQ
jgi:hypothetical protein